MSSLPHDIWRVHVFPFLRYTELRGVCRTFERDVRHLMEWRVPPSMDWETVRDRCLCAGRLLDKNPAYACIGGFYSSASLTHYIFTMVERRPSTLTSLMISEHKDLLRVVALLRAATSLTTLVWEDVDDDDIVPWEILSTNVLSRLVAFRGSAIEGIRYMTSLRHFTFSDTYVDIRDLNLLRQSIPATNQLRTIVVGTPDHDHDMTTYAQARAGRMVRRIIQKCPHLQYIRVSGMVVSLDELKRAPASNNRVIVDVTTRVVLRL
jgi:hypothetical protein